MQVIHALGKLFLVENFLKNYNFLFKNICYNGN